MSWFDTITGRALVEAVCVSALGGVVGTHIALRRLTFFTLALTHVTLPGVVVGALLGVDLYVGGGVSGALLAVVVVAAARLRGQHPAAAVGIGLSGGFALGAVLLSATPGFSRNVADYTAGDLLSVSGTDLAVTVGLGAAIAVTLFVAHRVLVFTAFDRAGARAAGVRVVGADVLLLLCVEAAVLCAVAATGVILAIALLAGPAVTARLWTSRIALLMPLATAIGVCCAAVGVAVSVHADVAAGGAIAVADAVAFAVSLVVVRVSAAITARRRPA